MMDPCSLPPAGRPVLRDSPHEDYRVAAALSPHRLRMLQTSQGQGDTGAATARWPASPRDTNPLLPVYKLPSAREGALPYPTATREPDEWRWSSPPRSFNLTTSDIAGAQPKQPRHIDRSSTRQAEQQLPQLSPVKQRLLKEGAVQRPAPDTRPLGLWGSNPGGCDIHFYKTHRSEKQSNPLSPTYSIHGQQIADPPGAALSAYAASHTAQTLKRLRLKADGPQSSTGSASSTPRAVSIVDQMASLAVLSNTNMRSPQRRGHGRNLQNLHGYLPMEVNPVQW